MRFVSVARLLRVVAVLLLFTFILVAAFLLGGIDGGN